MELLPKWELTGTLPAFSDDDSSTCIEMTYKLYNTMQTLISEYNSFADSVNSKILAFKNEYNSHCESFTTSLTQEIQEFTSTFNSNIANLNSRVSEVDSKYQTSTTNLQNQINTINNILASDDVNLDTLQELVNALKNNVSSINDLFTELAKKVNITDYNAKITSIETQINTLSNNTYTKSEIDTKVNTINSNITSLSNNTYTKAEVDNLVASSGGSSGSKKYLHSINIYNSWSGSEYFGLIVNELDTPYTESSFANYLYSNGYTNESNYLKSNVPVTGLHNAASKPSFSTVYGVISPNGTQINFIYSQNDFSIVDGVLTRTRNNNSIGYGSYFRGDIVYEL